MVKPVKNALRTLAAAAWAAGNFSMKACLRIFRASLENSQLPMPLAPERMIRKWGK
jgi:hypothetical protein